MFKVRPALFSEIEEVSKMFLEFLNEPKVSDNNVLSNEINRKYWIEFVSNLLAKDKECLAVAEADNKIVGYSLFNMKASEPFLVKEKWCYISDLYVDKNHRNRGIGSGILSYIEDIAKRKEVKKIRLIVWAENENALKFYEKRGFRIVGYLMEKEV